MRIKEILSYCKTAVYDSDDFEVSAITHIAEKIDNGTLFFDLPHTDGRQRALAALKTEPIAVVCEATSEYLNLSLPIIVVDDARLAYAHACYAFYKFDRSKLRIVGVTGTCGKTTTATLIYKMARVSGLSVGFIGTGKIELNGKLLSDGLYSMTTPDPDLLYKTLRDMSLAGATLIVMEVSSHALYLSKVSPLIFDIGIFTGLSAEHLDFHKNMEDYFRAKELLVKKSTLGIISTLDSYGVRLYQKYKNRSLSVGSDNGCDAYSYDRVQDGLQKSCFAVSLGDYEGRVSTNLVGEFNEANILTALCCIKALGLEVNACVESLKDVYIDGRLNITKEAGITVIKDFAHTPEALEKLLKLANSTNVSGQKVIVVFGCGGERDSAKRPLMARCATVYSDFCVITSDNPRGESRGKILSDMLLGTEARSLAVILDRRSAIEYAIAEADDGDTVVIAGKGHEKYIIEKDGVRYFSEDEIISYALNKRKAKRS